MPALEPFTAELISNWKSAYWQGKILKHFYHSSDLTQHSMQDHYRRKRIILLIMLVILIPAGFLAKLYSGPGSVLLNNKFAGTLYVVFWSFLAACIFIRKSPYGLVIVVFLITCGLEFLQLYSSPLLESIRSTFLGRSLIGNSFNWGDIVFYLLGSVLSYFWLRKINQAYLPPSFIE